jgi:hypothetical protein
LSIHELEQLETKVPRASRASTVLNCWLNGPGTRGRIRHVHRTQPTTLLMSSSTELVAIFYFLLFLILLSRTAVWHSAGKGSRTAQREFFSFFLHHINFAKIYVRKKICKAIHLAPCETVVPHGGRKARGTVTPPTGVQSFLKK